MTTAPVLEHAVPVLDERGAEWRRLGDRLWAGKRAGRPIGTIERGRRYTWIDEDGVARASFDRLEDAQAAAGSSLPYPGATVAEPLWREIRDHAGLGPLAITTTFAGLLAVALSATGLIAYI